jgi:glycogen(starch) synthase
MLNEKLRLLWLTETAPPQTGGMAQSCDRIVCGLREAGVEVFVAHLNSNYADWRVTKKRAGYDIACPTRDDASHAMNRLLNFLPQITEGKPFTHVAAFGGFLPLLCAPVYAAWLDAPLIVLLRGNDFDAGVFAPARREVLFEAIKRAAHVCAVSRDKVERVEKLFPRARVSWTPNGISQDDFALKDFDRAQAQEWRAQTSKSRRVIGLFGQLKRKKGGLFFLEQLLRSGCAARFHVLLIGALETEMQTWLAAHETEMNLTALPFLDRFALLPHYAACDFVAIPSFYDGMPNVLLEAAALGVPLIASQTGGMADVLIDDEHALLFAAGDAHSCRQAIRRAAEISDAAIERLSVNCRALAEKFDARSEIERYIKIFKETADERARR